jgi:uncharacterized protein (DUF2141 family)
MPVKRLIAVYSLFMIFYGYSYSQFTLTIEITGLRNSRGNIMLQLFDSNQKVIAEKMNEISDKRCIIKIPNLKPGKYAVRYYHDENSDSVMETNILGKPTEGYGFSNNVTGRFGPPPFDKWLFDITEDKKITLKPVY